MKFTAIVLASALVLSSTCALRTRLVTSRTSGAIQLRRQSSCVRNFTIRTATLKGGSIQHLRHWII